MSWSLLVEKVGMALRSDCLVTTILYFPPGPWIFHFKDDVTVVLLLVVSNGYLAEE